MGYLIGGAGEGPEEEIIQSGKDYSKLTDTQLLKLRDQTVKDIAKFNNFQMVRKICLNSRMVLLVISGSDTTNWQILQKANHPFWTNIYSLD